ncbi:SDR family NAD(P)-dependent oxidoreductase [Kineobactrum salinum]|uniref:SDR family NAD(P)-dependent oxidoreductase n=1 Tax=Kineobactrum salinum TaxID=2708301 RepID=A0A6C0U5I4_9GAMM|nr:SDR family NAD(P)-dependent oxidoreductase [Kineobactrum salinum]QIB66679.1 SDR family NAD(P)-dependent oxidoreductase [Kineobactrum salinum]
MNASQTVALVTGACSALGQEYCRQLAGSCDRLIAVARRTEELEGLAGELTARVTLIPLGVDLATVEGVTRVVETLRQQGPVDYLVNNAGFSTVGDFGRSAPEAQLQAVRLHIDAALELTRAALPFMRARGAGHIINVASIAAWLEQKDHAVYAASSAFMMQFSQSLQAEVAADHIGVQCLCPGLAQADVHQAPAVVAASLAALAGGAVMVVPEAFNRQLLREHLQRQLQSVGEQ